MPQNDKFDGYTQHPRPRLFNPKSETKSHIHNATVVRVISKEEPYLETECSPVKQIDFLSGTLNQLSGSAKPAKHNRKQTISLLTKKIDERKQLVDSANDSQAEYYRKCK